MKDLIPTQVLAIPALLLTAAVILAQVPDFAVPKRRAASSTANSNDPRSSKPATKITNEGNGDTRRDASFTPGKPTRPLRSGITNAATGAVVNQDYLALAGRTAGWYLSGTGKPLSPVTRSVQNSESLSSQRRSPAAVSGNPTDGFSTQTAEYLKKVQVKGLAALLRPRRSRFRASAARPSQPAAVAATGQCHLDVDQRDDRHLELGRELDQRAIARRLPEQRQRRRGDI